MRILILTPWFPCYPQAQHGNFILDSINSLIAMGHDVTVLVTSAWKFNNKNSIQLETFPDTMRIYNCRYLSIPRHYLSPISFWNYKRVVCRFIKKIIDKHQIQLIHAHTEYAGMAAVKVGNEMNVPTVITIHGVSTDKKLYSGITRTQLFEYPLSNANHVVLVGSSLTPFVNQFVNKKDHFSVIANGFRSHFTQPDFCKKNRFENQLCFISVSNLVEGKGIDINLRAFAKLKQIGINNWTYKIIGNGNQRHYLESLCNNLGLNQHVCFLGAIDHHKVYEQLDSADIFILPSYREAFGVAYLEAMSCGLLTIGVETQGPEDFIENGKTGILVKPKCVESLFDILKSLFETKNRINEIATAGMLYVHKHFTWEQHAAQLTNLYNKLVTTSR